MERTPAPPEFELFLELQRRGLRKAAIAVWFDCFSYVDESRPFPDGWFEIPKVPKDATGEMDELMKVYAANCAQMKSMSEQAAAPWSQLARLISDHLRREETRWETLTPAEQSDKQFERLTFRNLSNQCHHFLEGKIKGGGTRTEMKRFIAIMQDLLDGGDLRPTGFQWEYYVDRAAPDDDDDGDDDDGDDD